MGLYAFLDRLFPRSFSSKVFFTAFLGTHVPLIAVTVYALSRSTGIEDHLDELLLLIGATLIGCTGTLLSLWVLLAPLRRMRGAILAFEQSGYVVRLPEAHLDEIGQLMRCTNTVIRSIEQRHARAYSAALTDSLTGLPNRRGFEALAPALGTGAVLFLDLDHFKQVNDTQGHAAGDAVLKGVAGVISATMRRQDVVARWGGEEFVIWLPGATEDVARGIGERLRLAISDRVPLPRGLLTASIGIAVAREGDSRDRLIARADAALYAAKAGGRNRVVAQSSERETPVVLGPESRLCAG
ncbi:MAG: GGDEF domain-containing protein [Rhodobacteraceae bacterium]|jgi:diguanylate cyclase (GGDEF)-like protein|uniref:diguanylate cyclase n=1 Tax=Salipiger profundus TaxID=1229727 RepID=A0A1U7D0M5_9RHOB|nr:MULTISPECIES: GGDEF domain-containing protein [Salipiger]APX21640.1 diguanylate cyclase (GGDEF) domain-containing protein [Salipiger profundus]MAB08318.1 GGDEF domain-containing protein [Paracoccaceae bacterium]GGA00960.1 transcriptional regulator [Salipiger profundus]SFC12254.1 diguanylate cyclase (GGDEF) domain-containing protein [Salipiger profundus]